VKNTAFISQGGFRNENSYMDRHEGRDKQASLRLRSGNEKTL